MFINSIISVIISFILFFSFKIFFERIFCKKKPVIIIGSGSYCSLLIAEIHNSPKTKFQLIAIYNEICLDNKQIAGLPVVSEYKHLIYLIKKFNVTELWLVLPLYEENYIFYLVNKFKNSFINIRFMPDIRNFILSKYSINNILGFPAINLSVSQANHPAMISKNIFDRIFALIMLLFLSPILFIIAILVKLDSPGAVFFKQKRMGYNGKEFFIYKFRSMYLHKEQNNIVIQATKNDNRITTVGRFLRKTSLDELPQFVNVLLGDMSVVGPRPHALEHDNHYKHLIEGYMYRYRIKPGITGWAQVNGFRGETDKFYKMASRIKYDLYYMQNWHFWFDIKILILTIKLFFTQNAY